MNNKGRDRTADSWLWSAMACAGLALSLATLPFRETGTVGLTGILVRSPTAPDTFLHLQVPTMRPGEPCRAGDLLGYQGDLVHLNALIALGDLLTESRQGPQPEAMDEFALQLADGPVRRWLLSRPKRDVVAHYTVDTDRFRALRLRLDSLNLQLDRERRHILQVKDPGTEGVTDRIHRLEDQQNRIRSEISTWIRASESQEAGQPTERGMTEEERKALSDLIDQELAACQVVAPVDGQVGRVVLEGPGAGISLSPIGGGDRQWAIALPAGSESRLAGRSVTVCLDQASGTSDGGCLELAVKDVGLPIASNSLGIVLEPDKRLPEWWTEGQKISLPSWRIGGTRTLSGELIRRRMPATDE